MAPPYLSRLDGGDPDDDSSEFVRICSFLAGLGGTWPSDFNLLAVAEKFHLAPWLLEDAPAVWFKRMSLYLRTESQAAKDRESNQKG